MIITHNPATGTVLEEFSPMSELEVHAILDKAEVAFKAWRKTELASRLHLLEQLKQQLIANQAMLADTITAEMGKPTIAAQQEVKKCSALCDYYLANAEAFLQDEVIDSQFNTSYAHYEPLGVLLAMMPWNFPLWQVMRFLIPNLLVGNAVLLRHASNVLRSALLIEKCVEAAGYPAGLFRSLIITKEQVDAVIVHPTIRGVTLTGSEAAGREVAKSAGKHLKKSVLELGGSDPYVVLADADIKQAAKLCVQSRLANSGQVCIAAKRLIVVEEVMADFEKHIMEECKHYKIGDPRHEETQLGPLAKHALRERLHQQVSESVAAGAFLMSGGEIPAGEGYYYPITLLKNVTPGMPAYEQELFGPVIALLSAKNEQQAIEIANDTHYGLGAAIFSRDIAKAEDIAKHKLIAGTCAINTIVKSFPAFPFGGVKNSGYGRELASDGLYEFTNKKMVYG